MILLVLSWTLYGFIVGFIARVFYPGPQAMGFFATSALGVVGSFTGGMIGNVLVGAPVFAVHGAGILGSVFGALVVMALLGSRSRPVRT